jgi:hypothetical protein
MKINEQLMKRIKAFAWSAFWVASAAVVDHALATLGMWNLPTIDIAGSQVSTAVVAGLILTQLSKYVHNVKTGK